MRLLGSLMGGGGMASGGSGQLIGTLLSGVMGGGGSSGGLGSMLGAAAGGGGLGGMLGGLAGGGRSGGGVGGMLGGIAMAALTQFAASRMSGGGSGGGALAGLLGGGESGTEAGQALSSQEANSRAELLIRAMISAAKSDGRVDEQEKANILDRMGELDAEEVAFLKQEFAAPLDVDGLAGSVPAGMEQEVYAISLLAIEVDEQAEARYLARLAQGLGLDAARCNAIHREMDEPEIFR